MRHVGSAARPSDEVVVRQTDPEGERGVRAEVMRQSWEVAYHGIFSRAEIGSIFDGSLRLAGDWTVRRTAAAETLVAVLRDRVIGVAGLGLMEPGVGEVAALYVLPEHQGLGVGLRLWQEALRSLRARACTRLEVWTLARADARHFYEARGCAAVADGILRVGDHAEPVVGYGLALLPSRPRADAGDR